MESDHKPTSNAIIAVVKSIFASHGILEIHQSDNDPQYDSKEFSEFAKSYHGKDGTDNQKIAETFSRPSSSSSHTGSHQCRGVD